MRPLPPRERVAPPHPPFSPSGGAGEGFRAPWWCRNRHLQTLWGPLFRYPRLPLRRERLWTRDGDFVELDWLDGPTDAPLLLALHGLEGSACSHYVTGVLKTAAARGWRGVALNFRSCGGELNRLPRFYHAGDTDDLDEVVRHLIARDPAVRLGAVGVSIGGNVLLKWLGERGQDAPRELAGAVGISVPFDLERSTAVMDRGLRRLVYTASFMRAFRQKVTLKAKVYPGFVDVGLATATRTFAEYDRAVTAPLHGFQDERDYWLRASSGPYLPRIRRPALLINALDDPLVPRDALPEPASLPDAIRTEFPPRGGHAGFVEGRWPWRVRSWAEWRAVLFLEDLLPRRPRAG